MNSTNAGCQSMDFFGKKNRDVHLTLLQPTVDLFRDPTDADSSRIHWNEQEYRHFVHSNFFFACLDKSWMLTRYSSVASPMPYLNISEKFRDNGQMDQRNRSIPYNTMSSIESLILMSLQNERVASVFCCCLSNRITTRSKSGGIDLSLIVSLLYCHMSAVNAKEKWIFSKFKLSMVFLLELYCFLICTA